MFSIAAEFVFGCCIYDARHVHLDMVQGLVTSCFYRQCIAEFAQLVRFFGLLLCLWFATTVLLVFDNRLCEWHDVL